MILFVGDFIVHRKNSRATTAVETAAAVTAAVEAAANTTATAVDVLLHLEVTHICYEFSRFIVSRLNSIFFFFSHFFGCCCGFYRKWFKQLQLMTEKMSLEIGNA